MVTSRIERAHGYRERADELRHAAQARALRESRNLLIRLADEYETLAAQMEDREAERQT